MSDDGSYGSEEEILNQDNETAGPCGCWGSSVSPGWRHLSFVVLLLWGWLVYNGKHTVPELMSKTGWVPYAVPPGSESLAAKQVLRNTFPLMELESKMQITMIIKCMGDTPTVYTESVRAYQQEVVRKAATDWRTRVVKPMVTGYFVGNPRVGLKAENPILKFGFMSYDGRTALLNFMPTAEAPPDLPLAWWQVRDNILQFLREEAEHPPPGMEVYITGAPAISADSTHDNSIEMIARAELCTLPVAIFVLGVLIRDLRLLIIPPLSLLTSFMLASVLVLQMTKFTPNFSSDIPTVMGSVTVALGLDYSLFLLTRFNENRQLGCNLQDNVRIVLEHTVHTIGISGSLIAVAFFGAVSIPEENLQTSGIALGLTTIACMIANATFVPAFLLFAGRFLTVPLCGRREARSLGSGASSRSLLSAPSGVQEPKLSMGQGFWFWLMRLVAPHPMRAVVVVLVAFSPLLAQLRRLHTTADTYAMLPETIPSVHALHILDQSGFPVGRFEPYEVVIKTWLTPPGVYAKDKFRLPFRPTSAMLTKKAFAAMFDLAWRLNATGGVAGMLGPPWLVDQPVDWDQAKVLHRLSAFHHPLYHKLYVETLYLQVQPQSAVIQVMNNFLPRGPGAADWILQARKLISEWEQDHDGFVATLSGGAGAPADIRVLVMNSMWGYVGFTVLAVMTVVLFMFRSVLLCIRLAFALLFTLGATFGIAVVVYQSPALYSLFPWLELYNGLTYECVPVATCIAVALGLDYDIFLITRVVEYRLEGYSDRDSIVQGVVSTGSIISGAGIIMSLAFAGLLFSSKLMLNQMGMLMVVSVVLDTFVVRTVLVPALMLSAGDWNWWPRRMPKVTESARLPLDALSPCDSEEDDSESAE